MSAFTNTNSIGYLLNNIGGTIATAVFAGGSTANGRFVSVWTGDPQGAGVECTGSITGGVTRPTITFAAYTTGQSIASNNTCTITSSAAAANTVTYIGLHSNSSTTNATSLMASVAVTSKTLGVGDALSIPVGNCSLSIS
jgi:hypothetical protein